MKETIPPHNSPLSACEAWLIATRPKTLPLALSGILIAASMAAARGYFRWDIFLLSALTALSFQVLANWSNDYGDALKGADNAARRRPRRAVASGAITAQHLLRAIISLSLGSFLLALLLIFTAFDGAHWHKILLFICLGAASVWAALAYTMGKSPYGYRARGDLYVFMFFGLIAVQGGYYLYDHTFLFLNFFPASAIGCFSVGVLNLNNLRDCDSDKVVGKHTLVVKIGFEKSKLYQFLLVSLPYFSTLIYNVLLRRHSLSYLFLLSFIPVVQHMRNVFQARDPLVLAPELPRLALIALSFSVLFALGELLSAVPVLNGV